MYKDPMQGMSTTYLYCTYKQYYKYVQVVAGVVACPATPSSISPLPQVCVFPLLDPLAPDPFPGGGCMLPLDKPSFQWSGDTAPSG